MKVIVLGATGMLGSMVLDYLSAGTDFQISATARRQSHIRQFKPHVDNIDWRLLNAENPDVNSIAAVIGDNDWAVNAIGVIKPYIHDNNAVEVERAVAVNALFPHRLAKAASLTGCRVIQIATDCVYSGRKGNYTEKDEFDPLDVYGKTKSLGEVFSDKVFHLRCSIIGPEPKVHSSLMDWFLGQPRNGKVDGYTNHHWNGVSTLHFAKICRGIIKDDIKLPHVQHVIPAGSISKAEMLRCFAREFKREDIAIGPVRAEFAIDRTLATANETLNRTLWEAAGYKAPPSVPEMVSELARFNYRFKLEGDL